MLKNPSAYGLHACMAMLKNPKREIKHIVLRQGDDKRYAELLTLATARGVLIKRQTQERIEEDYPGLVHQGVLLWAKALPDFDESDLKSLIASLEHPAFILILDGVTDPHNLGACLRSADAAGVDMVIIPKDKSASMTPVVAKVSSGASETVPLVRVVNLARSIEALQALGVWVYGACGEATQSLYDLDATGAIALVLGAEGDGLRRLTREKCDGLYAIPMLGSVSSLNVSVAAGVSVYEVRRQRL
ncbi:MAG: 23S rRNA (guanosine(2251)-2'-O)-methyltransferase RlmB [Gammaproteobacteria bacterium]|nr:23S rRNA (guanosine(2251)-2'-O)-methyltransferase RlmB [Gammaproteobacteria bacterium]